MPSSEPSASTQPRAASGAGLEASPTPGDAARLLGLELRPRRRPAARVAIALAVLVVVVVLGGLFMKRRAAAAEPKYTTAALTRGDLRVTVTATGTLQATKTVEVGAEVTGRVIEVKVDANDPVTRKQVLATIDPEQLRATAEQARAQLAAADAAIRQAKATRNEAAATLDRVTKQTAEGLASQRDLEAAKAAAERAEGGLASAAANASLGRAALNLALSKLDKTTILSPIDGIVLSRLIEPGQTVTAGFQTPILFKLAEDLTQMRLDVDVDEADIGRARDGQEASFTVEAFPERSFASRVLRLLNEPKTSQSVVTYRARLSVDNSERLLRPGMTATATIVTDTKRAVLLVPNAALRFEPPAKARPGGEPKRGGEVRPKDERGVYVLDGGVLRRVELKVGATDGANTEVLSGELAPGALVVTDAVTAP